MYVTPVSRSLLHPGIIHLVEYCQLPPLITKMRVICLASLFAATAAFTAQPHAFTTNAPLVGERASGVPEQGIAHRNRRATIVMDGKANGEYTFYVDFVPGIYWIRTRDDIDVCIEKYQFSPWAWFDVQHPRLSWNLSV
jgi:hypothetical protein